MTPILIVGYYLVFCYSFPVNYEFYLRRTKSIAIGTLSAAVLNIILNLALIPVLGLIGASLATLIAYGMLFLFHSIMVNRMDINNGLPYVKLLVGILVVLVFAFLATLLRDITWLRLGIGFVIAILLARQLLKEKAFF